MIAMSCIKMYVHIIGRSSFCRLGCDIFVVGWSARVRLAEFSERALSLRTYLMPDLMLTLRKDEPAREGKYALKGFAPLIEPKLSQHEICDLIACHRDELI